MAALLVASHHVGLLNLVAEGIKGGNLFRVEDPSKRMRGAIEDLVKRHLESLSDNVSITKLDSVEGEIGNLEVFLRMALSCLVDADHTDSSYPNKPLGEVGNKSFPSLLPERRLDALDAYVAQFKSQSERDVLRRDIYASCRGQTLDDRIVACDSPVGSGKTTAVMAHLLSVASKRGLRRVFVVLPFTNIIRQSVAVYKKALVLPGEKPEEIIAEVHHLVDFCDDASRELAVQWNAPIVVTTAVAFFETLAASRPTALRRLHELAGSAVFVDEAHAALPAKFLPIAWQWMQSFADEWNVHWVLASGSLVKFWRMKEVLSASGSEKIRSVPFVIDKSVRGRADEYEQLRVSFKNLEKALSIKGLVDAVAGTHGPRLVILNTVQNAAVVAKAFVESNQFSKVFHLSTALTPVDRARTLEDIKKQFEADDDENWVLVGTSCIEAGMDFDFATGFREMSSLASLLQTSGRVNRSGKRKESNMYSFCFLEEDGINKNCALEDSIRVLRQLFAEKREVSAELCTEALRRELLLNPRFDSLLSKVIKAEKSRNFPEVERLFKIICADTRTVVVSADLIRRIESFEPVDWREIQENSVQMWGCRIDELHIPELCHHSGVYAWNLEYSPFLGIMEGILRLKEFLQNGGGVL